MCYRALAMNTIPCPHCGHPLSPRAVACRECGSDIETGWSEEIDYYSVELPEEEISSSDNERVRKQTIAILLVVLLVSSSGVLLFFGVKNVGVIILILGLGLPIALGKRPDTPDDRE